MKKIIVGGIGTEVGKTTVAAILVTLFNADYWKPIESGTQIESDTSLIKDLVNQRSCKIHIPAYSFKAPTSPMIAAELENRWIDTTKISFPKTKNTLVIETVGGILHPLNKQQTTLDLFTAFKGEWVIVSQNYLGSINHTLLTIEALVKREATILGIVFNGKANPKAEKLVLDVSKLSCLGRLLPEKKINKSTVEIYSKKWKQRFTKDAYLASLHPDA